jgi:chromosome partitioning protein
MGEDNRDNALKIAVSSQKGGVAKTTTCVSLGACLAEQGYSVMVVDLDPQAHLTRSLGVDPDGLRRTVGDALLYQSNLIEISRESALVNLDLVPANRGLILVEKYLHTSKGFEYRLKNSLDAIHGRYYDVVLFDCPPSFGPLTMNALTASGLVIIPVTCDYFSAQSLQAYLRLLNILRRNTNANIEYRLLVTMFDGRTRLSRFMLDQYRQKFGAQMFEVIIPMDNKLRESAVFNLPITEFAASARSAQEYRSLARELMTCRKKTI